jgi:DNA uptake protein ComE-like DNA-binding protein
MKKQLLFSYRRRERNGVLCLFLIVLCVLLWRSAAFSLFPEKDKVKVFFEKRQDSKFSKQQQLYRFNPNFITDEFGYRLGMSVQEIDRLLCYRSEKKWVRSIEKFQEVTLVSDSLLAIVSKYFRFPAVKEKQKILFKKDLNSARAKELQSVYGVGPILSKRIVRYRKRLQGFSMEKQLREVWGLKSEVLERILRKFEIKNAPRIEKTNINTATFKEVLSIMYLDYPQTLAVFRYKDARGKIETLEELKKIEGFPVEKYDRIVLYLQAQ